MTDSQKNREYDSRDEKIREQRHELRQLRQYVQASEFQRQRRQKYTIGGVVIIAGVAWWVHSFGLPSFVANKVVDNQVTTTTSAPLTTTTPPPPVTDPVVATIPPMTVPEAAPPTVEQKPAATAAPKAVVAQPVKVWGFDTCPNPNPEKVKKIEAMAGPFVEAQVKGFVCS